MDAEVSLVIAVVGVGIAMVGVVISMMFWVRTEANAIREDQKADRKELLQISRNIEMEMRDFHLQLLEMRRQK
jgi:hypothetical protein